nr:response regulator [Cohnella faecalis]
MSFTSLPGRDALLRMPESLKPAAVMMMPIAPGQLRKCLVSLQRNDHWNGQRKLRDALDAVQFQGLVLVVDDQPVNRLVAGELLSQYGLQALTAESGAQAIEMVKLHPFSLILMDLHMPEMDGLETTMRIRSDENSRNVPIVALTADTMPEQRSRCLIAGMNEVLLKPIMPDRLLEVLYRWLPPPLSAQPQIAAGTEWLPRTSRDWTRGRRSDGSMANGRCTLSFCILSASSMPIAPNGCASSLKLAIMQAPLSCFIPCAEQLAISVLSNCSIRQLFWSKPSKSIRTSRMRHCSVCSRTS